MRAAVSTAPLFLVAVLPSAGSLLLDGPEGRHAVTVKRLRAGEAVLLADGRVLLAAAYVTGTLLACVAAVALAGSLVARDDEA